jgi:hypothetical protein
MSIATPMPGERRQVREWRTEYQHNSQTTRETLNEARTADRIDAQRV